MPLLVHATLPFGYRAKVLAAGPSRRAAEPSDELAPSKANAHLALPRDSGSSQRGGRRYDCRAMHIHKHLRHDDKTASRLARKGRNGRFDFYVAMNERRDWLDLERPGRHLKRWQLSRCGEHIGIEHDCDPL
jgi:hypothetical protein